MNKVSVLASFIVFFFSVNANAQRYEYQRNNPIFDPSQIITLTQGQSVTIETRNLSTGSDTVLRLLKLHSTPPQVDQSWSQVAVDDNSNTIYGARASKINYTATSTGYYRVIVHSYSSTSHGTMDYYVNGTLKQANAPFGGLVHGFSLAYGESIHTGFAPGGVFGHQMLVVPGTYPGGGSVSFFANRNMTQSRHYLPIEFKNTTATTNSYLVIFSGKYSYINEKITILKNNPNVDADSDGVGDILESYIGTCRNNSQILANGFNCSNSNPIDSDNDGYYDSEEIFGASEITCDPISCPVTGAFPFALWGSNPLKKDVFVQTDIQENLYSIDSIGDPVANPPIAINSPDLFDQPKADRIALSYKDLGNAAKNPSGNGISLHFDILDSDFLNTTVSENIYSGAFFDSGFSGSRTSCGFSRDHMSNFRKKYMKYACINLGWNSTGGQADNYHAYVGGGDSWTITHEMGHNFRLTHGGMPGRSYNYKPNYRSLMSYAFNIQDLSENLNPDILNPSSVNENSVYSTPTIDAFTTGSWNLQTIGNKLDFNRDQAISNYQMGYPVQFASVSNYVRGAGMDSSESHGAINYDIATPDVTHNANRSSISFRYRNGSLHYMYHMYINNAGDVKYNRVSTSPKGDCLTPDFYLKNIQCGNYTTNYALGLNSIVGISADTIFNTATGKDDVYLSTVDQSGSLKIYQISINEPSGTVATLSINYQLSTGTILTSILRNINNKMVSIRLTSANYVAFLSKASPSSAWTQTWAVDVNTSTYIKSKVAPSITFNEVDNSYYLLTTEDDTNARLNIYKSTDLSGSNWVKVNTWASSLGTEKNLAQASIQWLPFNVDYPSNGGYFMVAFNNYEDLLNWQGKIIWDKNLAFVYHLYMNGTARKGLLFNIWSIFESGKDIYYKKGDTSPKLVTNRINNGGKLWVYPNADGRFNYNLKDFNDFDLLYSSICDNSPMERSHCLPPKPGMNYDPPVFLPNGLIQNQPTEIIKCDLK